MDTGSTTIAEEDVVGPGDGPELHYPQHRGVGGWRQRSVHGAGGHWQSRNPNSTGSASGAREVELAKTVRRAARRPAHVAGAAIQALMRQRRGTRWRLPWATFSPGEH